MGHGGVDVQSLRADAPLALARQVAQIAHVVQPIENLNLYRAQIPEGGGYQFAVSFDRDGPPAAAGLGLHRGGNDLGHPVHHLGQPVPVLFPYLLLGDLGVLDDIVQQRDNHRFDVQSGLGHHQCHPRGMINVRFTGLAALVAVMKLRVRERLFQQADIGCFVAGIVTQDRLLDPRQAAGIGVLHVSPEGWRIFSGYVGAGRILCGKVALHCSRPLYRWICHPAQAAPVTWHTMVATPPRAWRRVAKCALTGPRANNDVSPPCRAAPTRTRIEPLADGPVQSEFRHQPRCFLCLFPVT